MNAERGFELHPGAASDITSIWEFIAKDNPLAAKRVREDILDAIRRLIPFPHQGHQRRDLASRPVRFWARSSLAGAPPSIFEARRRDATGQSSWARRRYERYEVGTAHSPMFSGISLVDSAQRCVYFQEVS